MASLPINDTPAIPLENVYDTLNSYMIDDESIERVGQGQLIKLDDGRYAIVTVSITVEEHDVDAEIKSFQRSLG